MKQETVVVIVGAGPAGIATSACLNNLSIPNVLLEREDCYASLWQKRSYDRLKLHLAKQFCQLPNMPFPRDAPTFISKNGFIQYLADYVSQFNVKPLYQHSVEGATFDEKRCRWHVVSKNLVSGVVEEFEGRFLVVATGENSEGFIPKVLGLDGFSGTVMHSSQYQNGKIFHDKEVLVVGSGNSGMEIAYDLWSHGAETSIVVRNPVHVLTKEIVQMGMCLLKFLPVNLVDNLVLLYSKLKYGDLSCYGVQRPSKGPFLLKLETGRSPVIDVGTMDLIKKGGIKVLSSMSNIDGDQVEFVNGERRHFKAIVFATGYKSTVKKWLKDDEGLFDEQGMPKNSVPDHWKGGNGLYCVGFARSGLFGISRDAENISNDIFQNLSRGLNN